MPDPATTTDHPARRLRLCVMATSDLHLTLGPWDHLTDRPAPGRGLAGLVPLIMDQRARSENCLLLDNGDSLFGFPIGASAAQSAAVPQPATMLDLMGQLGFDAANLGNHDFDMGLPALTATLAKAPFPVLLTNGPGPGRPWLRRAIIARTWIDSAGTPVQLRIGLIGLVNPDPALLDPTVIGGPLRLQPLVPAARRATAALRRQGADLVIALVHDGLDPDACPAVAALPGIDLLIAGHRHQVFPGPLIAARPDLDPQRGLVAGKPCVMPGAYGSHLGVIDLEFQFRRGVWALSGSHVRAIRSSVGPPPDLPVIRQIDEIAARTRARLSRPVSQVSVPLNNHLSRIGPDRLTALIAQSYRQAAVAMMPAHVVQGLPLLVALPPPARHIEISPGPVTERHIAALCAYPGNLTILAVTGALVRDWLDRGAAAFARLTPGQTDQPLLDPAMPGYLADQIDGLTYDIALTAPARFDPLGNPTGAASRIGALRIGGLILRPRDSALLVTTSYRTRGGGGFAMARRANIVAQGTTTLSAALCQGLHDPVPATPPGWRLMAPPGTAAWFDSPGPAPSDRRELTALPVAPPGLYRLRLAWGLDTG